jgi:hypothetical protein
MFLIFLTTIYFFECELSGKSVVRDRQGRISGVLLSDVMATI